ncbi:MAG: hypothetical protein WC139_13285 [Candidatus Kapaibacterium sp.]
MKNKLIIIAIAIFFSSCVTQRKCQIKFPPQVTTIIKDSIREVIKLRDTTIYVKLPADTVTISDTIYVKDGVTVFKEIKAETILATARVWIGQNRLNLTLADKDTTLTIKLKDALKTSEFWQSKYVNEKQVVEVKYTPKFIKVLAWIGGVCIILLILWLLRRFSII